MEKTGTSGHLAGGGTLRADCWFVEVSQVREREKGAWKDAEMAGVIQGPGESWKRKRLGVVVLKCSRLRSPWDIPALKPRHL